ncbi:hypothetical protein [Streptomyces sp. NPDC094437]|uniref:hypothetical protein n=1 Tax=Streptomyces sp. NPDC094437 TaxID=3366060 RepID=UPI00380E3850
MSSQKTPDPELAGAERRKAAPERPAVGCLVHDLGRDVVAEFRAALFGRWYLRPVTGGVEWDVDPRTVRLASPEQRLRVELARANAQSRTNAYCKRDPK